MLMGLGAPLSGASAFTPATLTPTAWWDASDTATISHVAGAVTQIDDKSGNGNHFVQDTGSAQPKTGTRTINSLNVLDFDGGDFMSVTSFTHPASFHLFMAALVDATDHNNDSIWAFTGTVLNYWCRAFAQPAFRAQFFENGTATWAASSLADDIVGAACLIDGAFDATADTIAIARNGVSYHTASDYDVASGESASIFMFGNAAGSQRPDGAVMEYVLLPAPATGDDATAMRGYFTGKWGVP